LVEIQKPREEYVVQFSRNHGGSPWLTGDKHSGVAEITVGMANSVSTLCSFCKITVAHHDFGNAIVIPNIHEECLIDVVFFFTPFAFLSSKPFSRMLMARFFGTTMQLFNFPSICFHTTSHTLPFLL